MSSASSNAGAWFTRLEPARWAPPTPTLPHKGRGRNETHSPLVREGWGGGADDPRLGALVTFWRDGLPDLQAGRPVLIGFPQDEGVRRNHGRPGAAAAPAAIRTWLYRLTPWDAVHAVDLAALRLLDVGDVRIVGNLEDSQRALAEVVAAILRIGAVPIILGGGHETAYGHYLGYVLAGRDTAILNLDAHLDVRPYPGDLGHSGSPFRQAHEHPARPLRGDRYAVLGAQPHAVSREHQNYVQRQGGVIRWASEVRGRLETVFRQECERLAHDCSVYVSLDADVARQADVPGVSAPNPLGLSGSELVACAAVAGASPMVSSFEVVEINPSFDRDDQSARWAALVVWHFLRGLAQRSG
jgi:formiminoglutamase